MSYESFKRKVKALIDRAGGGIEIKFYHDWDNGRFYAYCSDGTTIIGHSTSIRVTVRWGYHMSMAEI